MKQTAVEWLVDKVIEYQQKDLKISKNFDRLLIANAKEIEKEQTLHFGAKCCLMTTQQNDLTLEELYNETFNE